MRVKLKIWRDLSKFQQWHGNKKCAFKLSRLYYQSCVNDDILQEHDLTLWNPSCWRWSTAHFQIPASSWHERLRKHASNRMGLKLKKWDAITRRRTSRLGIQLKLWFTSCTKEGDNNFMGGKHCLLTQAEVVSNPNVKHTTSIGGSPDFSIPIYSSISQISLSYHNTIQKMYIRC